MNVFVAGFIGSPAMNFLEATATAEADHAAAVMAGGSMVSFDAVTRRAGIKPGEKVLIGIRPEHIKWQPSQAPVRGFLRAQVDLVEHLEPESFVVATIADPGGRGAKRR